MLQNTEGSEWLDTALTLSPTTAATMDMTYTVQNQESANMMEAGMETFQCADRREVCSITTSSFLFNCMTWIYCMQWYINFAGDCPKLYAPKYGKIRVTGYGPDSVAYYSCDYGYGLYGPSSRKCQYDGSWYGKVPVCRPKRRSKLTIKLHV